MDILIKGIEMPQERKMFVIEADGSVWVQIADTSYFCTGSKAVALPEHGRLGDLDALQKQIEDDIETVAKEKGKVGLRELWQILNKNIENAPVIVEANT